MSPAFSEQHAPTGTITNQPGAYRADQPHASTAVCDRPECREKATFWVQGVTGQAAHYRPYRGAEQ